MKFPIRVRILLWVSFIIGELMILLAVFLHYQLTTYLYQNFDQYIQYKLEEYSTQFLKKNSLVELVSFFENEVKRDQEELGIFILLFSREEQLLYRSSNIEKFSQENPFGPPKRKEIALGQFRDVTILRQRRVQTFRVITVPIRGSFGELKDTYLLQVAFTSDSLANILIQHRSSILSAFGVIFLLTLTMAWLVASKAFQPIELIIQQAEDISASNLLQKRLSLPGTKDELDRLVLVLNKMLNRIEHSVKKIQQFTTNAAHEIRTPLTTIRGELELFLLYPEKERQESKIAFILEEIERLNLLCKRLVLLARLDEGLTTQQKNEVVSLGNLLRKLLEQMQPLFESHQITCEYEEKANPLLFVNEHLIFQVFLNLFDNAVKYMGESGCLRISLEKVDTNAIIVVADTGVGIASEHLPFIFDRFFRAEGRKEILVQGVGLGLAIVKEIVEFYSGTIKVESVLGQGTTFTLQFPAVLENKKK